MLISFTRGQTSVILRIKLLDSSVTTGAGLTGLTSSSAGLLISTAADNEATPTVYSQAGSTIETIAALGTYAAPTATKCRFAEYDSTNHPGVYEVQLADARFAVASAKSLVVSISGAANCAETDALIPLTDVDPYDTVRGGMTALPDAVADAAGGLPISDAGNLDLDTLLARLDAAITSRNSTVPDAAGTAASLHATTDGKVDDVKDVADTVAIDVAGLDGDAMRGTDGANTTVPDAAGTAASLHATTDALVTTVDAVVDAIKAVTDNLPNSGSLSDLATLAARLTAARAGYLDKLNVVGTLANTDNAASFMADVSLLAAEATLTAMKGSGWTDETLKAIMDAVEALSPGDATLANQTIIKNRLGAWTATGDNTVLGAIKAMASKIADAPSDIGGTFAPSTDSLEAIRDKLTSTTISVVNPINAATNAITLYRASDYTTASVSGTIDFTLTDWAGLTIQEIWFTVKREWTQSDTEAAFQKTYTDGDISITGASGLDISVAVDAADLATLETGVYKYDVKLKTSSTVDVAVVGTLTLEEVATRATS